MAFRTIKLLPGVTLEQSVTLNQTMLAQTNLCRFYGGLVQKLGGWQKVSPQTFIGTCRGLHGWADVPGNAYLAMGTEQRLEVNIGGAVYDITPLAQTDNLAPAFTTTISSASVQITDASYSPTVGDWINITTQVSVGGIVLFGYYQVATVVNSSNFTITAASAATANASATGAVPSYTTINTLATVTVTLNNHGYITGSIYNAVISTTVGGVTISGVYSVTYLTANTFTIVASLAASSGATASENSGNVQIQYLIPSGYAVNTPVTGYGIGDYGSDDYGLASSSATVILRQWSLDNWGAYLVASPSNGTIYYWNPPTVQPATAMSNAPLYNTAVFVMPQVQIIVALGAEISGTQQPLLIRWCDQANFSSWTATATNQAGSYLIPQGSKIVGGLAVGLGALIWTDTDLWSMTYLSFPLVFGFNRISVADGLVSQRAAATMGHVVMWLGLHQFYTYDAGGGVSLTECSVWDFYWNNVDLLQLQQITAAPNSLFNEIAWFFPLLSTSPLYTASAPLGYLKFNIVEKVWDYGLSSQYQRTAWTDHSAFGDPMGADLNGFVQQHEHGYDADGTSMNWSWQTGYFSIGDGEEFFYSDLIIPDFVSVNNPMFTPTVLTTDYPFATPTTVSTPTITATSNFITFSARGRQMALGIAGSDYNTFSRLGAFRVRYAPDGRN